MSGIIIAPLGQPGVRTKEESLMKKLFLVPAVLAAAILVSSPAFAADKKLTIGVCIPYEIGWFTAFHNGFDVVAKAEGVEVKWVYNNYKADEEVKAVQNLISLGVDGINLTAVTPESAQYSCQLANDANIPIQITESGTGQGRGKAIGVIDFDWAGIYRYVADNLRKDLKGDISVLWEQGFAGSPPVLQGIDGFKSEIQKLNGIKLATDVQYANYAVDKALDTTNAIIQSGVKFNVAIGGSQEMADGISTALKNANMHDKVKVVSVNGGPMDVDNFAKGNLDFALSQSPGLHGMITAANLIAYLRGKTYQTKTFSPVIWVNAQTYKKDLIPWDMDTSWMPVVNEFVKTGKSRRSSASSRFPPVRVSLFIVRAPGGCSRGPFHGRQGRGVQVESGNILETRGLSKSYPGVQALDMWISTCASARSRRL